MTAPINSSVPHNQASLRATTAPETTKAVTPTAAKANAPDARGWAAVDVSAAAKKAAELLATGPKPGAFLLILGPPPGFVQAPFDGTGREISGTLPPANYDEHVRGVFALLDGVRASLPAAPIKIVPARESELQPNALAGLVKRAVGDVR